MELSRPKPLTSQDGTLWGERDETTKSWIFCMFFKSIYDEKPVLRIWIRIGRIHVFGPPGSESGSESFCHHAKIVRKTLIPTVSRLLFDFLSLKNDVNVPSKSNKQKNFLMSWRSLTKIAGSGSITISQNYRSADPHPYQNFMDPRATLGETFNFLQPIASMIQVKSTFKRFVNIAALLNCIRIHRVWNLRKHYKWNKAT